ncbi:MAG: ferrochelatase [Planctomycetota bacterium]
MSAGPRIAIALFNLGGPHAIADVKPFLLNLFRDPDIFPLPALLRGALARLIVARRLKEVEHRYGLIGGSSPLLRWSDVQARLLEHALHERGVDAQVAVAMRYHTPTARAALSALLERGRPARIIGLPLYPHESIATTGSSAKDFRAALADLAPDVPFTLVREYHDHPLYIEALVECVRAGLAQFAPGDPVCLLFSAHSLPQKIIAAGDPYLAQIERTMKLVLERLAWAGRFELAFQSRAGPVRWLAPSTDQMLRSLAHESQRRVLVVPISFVSDHIETLFEIDMLYADQARALGITEFKRAPSINDSPTFIRAMVDVVGRTIAAAAT